MKAPYAFGLVAASVLITVAIEESRISSLRRSVGASVVEKATHTPATAAVSKESVEEPAPPVKTKSRLEIPPSAVTVEDSSEESFARTARKMWDNPAGKSMMNQGAKMAVAMMYQDFIDGLKLTKEETDYFKNLLGKEIADQQEIGMKMLGASDEEQRTLAGELTKRAEEAEAEIKKFLNNDEDIKAYSDYKKHLPEHQQLDGIRSALSEKGVPLDAETETKLVDAMYRARTEAKAPDLSGPGAMDELAKGNLVETYEKSWEIQQEALRNETSKILDAAQMTAFLDYQKQAGEMQLMGLRMAEKMMSEKKSGGK